MAEAPSQVVSPISSGDTLTRRLRALAAKPGRC